MDSKYAKGLLNSLDLNIPLSQYFESWIKNMNYLNSSYSRRINTIALLLSLKYAPQQTFLLHLKQILRETYPEVYQY